MASEVSAEVQAERLAREENRNKMDETVIASPDASSERRSKSRRTSHIVCLVRCCCTRVRIPMRATCACAGTGGSGCCAVHTNHTPQAPAPCCCLRPVLLAGGWSLRVTFIPLCASSPPLLFLGAGSWGLTTLFVVVADRRECGWTAICCRRARVSPASGLLCTCRRG